MQAKINISRMSRIREVTYEHLFVGNDPKGEVRAEWSSLYQALHRNKFLIALDIQKVSHGGKNMDEATRDFAAMFDRMETWCDANCTGIWTITDNEDKLDEDAEEVTVKVTLMFEREDDLMTFIRDCAVLMKLSY